MLVCAVCMCTYIIICRYVRVFFCAYCTYCIIYACLFHQCVFKTACLCLQSHVFPSLQLKFEEEVKQLRTALDAERSKASQLEKNVALSKVRTCW